MSVCKKLGIGLFVSTTMVGAVVIGIALFNRSHNIKDPFVIATWVSLAFITLSALITFNMLVNKTTKKPSYTTPISCSERVNTDPIINDLQPKHVDNNSHFQSSNIDVTYNPPASLITNDLQLDYKASIISNQYYNDNVLQDQRNTNNLLEGKQPQSLLIMDIERKNEELRVRNEKSKDEELRVSNDKYNEQFERFISSSKIVYQASF